MSVPHSSHSGLVSVPNTSGVVPVCLVYIRLPRPVSSPLPSTSSEVPFLLVTSSLDMSNKETRTIGNSKSNGYWTVGVKWGSRDLGGLVGTKIVDRTLQGHRGVTLRETVTNTRTLTNLNMSPMYRWTYEWGGCVWSETRLPPRPDVRSGGWTEVERWTMGDPTRHFSATDNRTRVTSLNRKVWLRNSLPGDPRVQVPTTVSVRNTLHRS